MADATSSMGNSQDPGSQQALMEQKLPSATHSDESRGSETGHTGIPSVGEAADDDTNLDDEYSSIIEDPSGDFKDSIIKAVKHIKAKLYEGKSLTKSNRESIVASLDEIQLLTASHCASSACSSNSPRSTELDRATVAVIRDTVKDEVSRLQRTIEAISKEQKLSYSSTLKNPPPEKIKKVKIPTTKPAIIVSPTKEVFSPAETHEIMKKNISFRDTEFAPANVKYVSNNKVLIEFDKPEHVTTTLAKINNADCPIIAEKSKKLRPMLILKGISLETPPEELSQLISKQNEQIKNLTTGQDDLVFKFKRSNRNEHLYNAVFLTTPAIWRVAIAAGKINVDHQRIHVEEYVPLLQCYKCLQFGHTRIRCTKEDMVCSHCAAKTHNFKDCPVKRDKSKLSCYNCETRSKRHNISLTMTNHSATSNDCPKVSLMTEKLRSRIDYGY
ncbi:hypothetical protein O0L34_g4094 [Tuta absoluta]|nr:hypothetical protein O0L34_g4094 [Tuta absoluta]